ncbi:Actin cortical patch SUR7/pH-response regulator PalI [Rhypophila decipiens]
MKRITVAIPVLASLAAFILILLALLAGQNPGYMEDYDILTLNTSALGKNLLSNALADDYEPTPTQSGGPDSICSDLPSFLGKACGSATSAVAGVQSNIIDKIDDINNDIADRLADRLGIHEFYSLHVLTICNGEFEPNATASEWKNVTSCQKGLNGYGYNISESLDMELKAGPFKITLADLGFTRSLQEQLDDVAKYTKALAILFIVTATLVGLSFLTSLLAIFLIPGRKESAARKVNLLTSALAVILLLVSSILVTVAVSMAVDKINEAGDDVGLSANRGSKYLVITWVATGLFLVLVFGFWLVQTWRWRKGGAKRNFPKGGKAWYGGEKRVRDSEETAGTGPRRSHGGGSRWSRRR